MTGIDYTLQLVRPANWQQTGKELTIALPDSLRSRVWGWVYAVGAKTNFHFRIRMDKPFVPRSTGYKSQNHHLRGHCKQIAQFLGLTMSEVHETIKNELALWPEKMINGPHGERFVKESEADISMEVCAAAIELCHVWAAHIGCPLIETGEEVHA